MSQALATDLYELNMAVSYLRHDMRAPATFSLFVRRLPATRGFLVAAGLPDCLPYLEDFHFTEDDLAYLQAAAGYRDQDLAALARLRFTGEVWAVAEGRLVFANEPLLEVTAPIAEAQLVESALLNHITFQTSIASKAARCRVAAGTADLVDFSLRRTHGLEAGAAVARVSSLVGFQATSNVAAARAYGLVPAGTMAHSYVEAFPDETAAFRTFAADFPERTTLLVDTYDTVAGVHRAVPILQSLPQETGRVGVRLDSGDLAQLATKTRRLLDDHGLPHVRIFASGGLDEYAIAHLVAAGAPIDAFGVGTKMGVSADAPSLDSAYKLVEYGGRPVAKLSPGKMTLPYRKQVFRSPGLHDLIGLRDEAPRGAERLLEPVMRDGRRLAPPEPLHRARQRFEADLAQADPALLAVHNPTCRTAGLTPTMRAGAVQLRDHLQER